MNEQISMGRDHSFLMKQMDAARNSWAQEQLTRALEKHLGRPWAKEDAEQCRMEGPPGVCAFQGYRFYYRNQLLGTMHIGDIEFSTQPEDFANNTVTASCTIQFIEA